MAPLFAIFNLTPIELMVILVIGVLLFGRKLPEVGRYLGKGITEFKKGVKGLEDEMDMTGPVQRPGEHTNAIEQIKAPQKVSTTAPKFEDSPNAAITAPPRV